ncbi:MAG: heparinase II/III family protein [Terracidiphilus sp.]|nr:heparinase II/III family protein [Terracidiphilus sp.]
MRFLMIALLAASMPVFAESVAERPPIPIPLHFAGVHPRIGSSPGKSQTELRALLARDSEARKVVESASADLAPYLAHVRADPMWVASRLQMYWKSHATAIYNRGDVFDYAEGHAPVATVRFPGSRNPVSAFRAPRLEDIPPYEDDTRGVLLVNSSASGQPLEWADPAKSGRVIDGINASIVRMAQNAAELAWLTGNEEYARFAFTIFDTYMRGMYFRDEPVDLLHGHSQTIYGMSTFEVIQEGNILPALAATYDFLYSYIESRHSDALPIYADTFRKWIEVTLHNGVPFNNWDLFEDNIAVSVALTLEDDEAYADRRGAQHYLNRILNEDTVCHWSLRKLAARGFDSETGIWFEAPGYSMTVVGDFVALINRIDRAAGTDLLQDMPVVRKSVAAMAQYAFPNGITVSWGDSHYGPISDRPARLMVDNARLHRRPLDEIYFTGLARFIDKLNAGREDTRARKNDARPRSPGLDALFEEDRTELNLSIPPLKAEDVFVETFDAPSVSYLAQRNGFDPQSGLMISAAGSLGNHQHANGITMELYGQGLPLAPDSGIGVNYFEADHNEYYAQFPAHNTVVVDGISSYPTMLSHHGFTVNATYPAPGPRNAEEALMTVADVSFLEPETNSDQRRVMGTIRLSDEDGYYIDIFRSHRRDGHDRTHDYFFHGLGQLLEIASDDGAALSSEPSDKLTFAEEALNAYDYLWEKRSVGAASMYCVRYSLDLPSRAGIQLNTWLAGAEDRQLFRALAPPARSLRDTVPAVIAALPLHTIVLRQSGEAWNHPFVSIFEPSRSDRKSAIQRVTMLPLPRAAAGAVALRVDEDGGRSQIVVDAVEDSDLTDAGALSCKGSYAVADIAPGRVSMLLSRGAWIATNDLRAELKATVGSAFVGRSGADLRLELSAPAVVEIPFEADAVRLQIDGKIVEGERMRKSNREWIRFALPATKLVTAKLIR